MYHSISTGIYISVNSSCAQPRLPPRATAGHLPAFSVPGVGHLQVLRCPGPGICQPRGYSRTFETHAVSYLNITTQRILLKQKKKKQKQKQKKRLGVPKACSRFYACIYSLLRLNSHVVICYL